MWSVTPRPASSPGGQGLPAGCPALRRAVYGTAGADLYTGAVLSGKRILIVTSIFARSDDEAWLVDDLAEALVGAGHEVDVIVADAKRARPRGLQPSRGRGLRVFSVGPQRTRSSVPGRVLAHAAVGVGLWGTGRRWARRQQYDLGIYTSIACFTWGLPGHLRRRGVIESLTLVLWDFFPIHQLQIGRIRSRWAAPVLKAVEAAAIRPADRVALMSPANVAFFHQYFPGLTMRTITVPPWSSSGKDISDVPMPPSSRLLAVFGGQLARGRGVETIVAAAAMLADEPIDIVVAGDGPERARLEQLAVGVARVRFVGQLARPEYRKLLGSAQVGLAVTVPGVSPPSFPSKIVEYCGLGLPVIVAVEPSSDAGTLVEARGAGLSIPVSDADALAKALRRLQAELSDGLLVERSQRARAYYVGELSAEAAARALLDTEGGADPTA